MKTSKSARRIYLAYIIGILVAVLIAAEVMLENRAQDDEEKAREKVILWRKVAIQNGTAAGELVEELREAQAATGSSSPSELDSTASGE